MQGTDTYRHKGLRKELVTILKNDQLGRVPITDGNVLSAIGRIPRHLFFGEDTIFHEKESYDDKPFPIYQNKIMEIVDGKMKEVIVSQTISQPYTVARQTELLEIKPGEKVLEIGTGSGYQAIVLMLLKARVYSIERHKNLYERTAPFLFFMKEFLMNQSEQQKTLPEKRTWKNEPEYWSVKCFYGDGFEGLPVHAPFDKILITAAVPELPKKLLQQLVLGGKMVLPFGVEKNCTMLRITKHDEGKYETEEFGKFGFVPMLKGKS